MDEEKKELKTITPVKVEQRSVFKDLTRYAVDEYIKPKTNDVLHDLFAGVIDMFGDAIRGAIDKQFYGEDRSRINRSKNNNVRTFNQSVPYNVYSLSPSGNNTQKQVRQNNSHRSGRDVKIISVDTEDKARYVISQLSDEISRYGNVKVGKFYELFSSEDGSIAITTTPEDWKYGWTDARDLTYAKEHGEYVFRFAEPVNVLNS